jgi:hypothetical protein
MGVCEEVFVSGLLVNTPCKEIRRTAFWFSLSRLHLLVYQWDEFPQQFLLIQPVSDPADETSDYGKQEAGDKVQEYRDRHS